MSAYLSRLAVPLGGIVKRSLAMVLYSCERAIAKAFGLDDATRDTRCVFGGYPCFGLKDCRVTVEWTLVEAHALLVEKLST